MQLDNPSNHSTHAIAPRFIEHLEHGIKEYGVMLGVVFVSLVVRLWDLDLPLNTDEAKWLSRGDEFFHSLITGNWADTYTSPHPGVSTMWVTGLGMALNSLISGINPDWVGADAPSTIGQFVDTRDFPIEMYRLPRLLHGLITSLCIGGIYLLTRRLFGWAIALVSSVLLLLEPFFLAYQRFLTTDALQSNFTVLAVLLLLLYLRSQEPSVRRSRRWLIGSGVCLGLAIGSKVISAFIIPGVLGLMLWTELQIGSPPFPAIRYGARAKALGLWGATALVTLFITWPALWLTPGFTLNRMAEGLLEEAQRGFFFFKGDLVDSPGLDFYPINLLYRLSPTVLVGTLIGAIALCFPSGRRRTPFATEQIALWLVIFSYVGVLSLATTKIDRYLSPVIPLLVILAAMGWLLLLHIFQARVEASLPDQRLPPLKSGATILLAGALAIAQLAIFLPHIPYYLTYYNPLLGGPRAAQDTLMIGQGEGIDQAAHWLSQEAHWLSQEAQHMTDEASAATFTISTVYPAVMFGYWNHSQTAAINHLPMRPEETNNPEFWQQAHRVMFYISQLQRQLPNTEFTDYFTTQPYEFEVQQDGINYAKIYPGPQLLQQEVEQIPYPVEIDYGDRIQLLGYALTTTSGIANEKPLLTLYWRTRQLLPRRTRLMIELRDRQGRVVYSTQDNLWGGLFPAHRIKPETSMRDAHVLNIPAKVTSDTYALYVGWRSRDAQSDFEPANSRNDSEEQNSTMTYVGVIPL
ncbi:MAG: glycosyltransferase family 39 protein [Elainellaceae cyanobacterium]